MSVTVELMVDGGWVDITRISDRAYVCSDVTITRGRADSQSEVMATQVEFDYLDLDALLDTDNPYSQYYRKIAVPGTDLRVSKDSNIRAHVTLDSMIPSWSDGEENVVVAVRGAGVFDEHESSDSPQPLASAALRAYSSVDNEDDRVAYWPLEEEEGALSISSPFSYPGATANFTNPIEFGSFTDSVSAARMLTFGSGGQLYFQVPFYSSTEHKIVGLWKYPSSALPSDTVFFRLVCTGGNITHIDLVNNVGGGGEDDFRYIAYNGFTAVDTATTGTFESSFVLDKEFITSCEFTQSGANLFVRLLLAGPDNDGITHDDTLINVTVGRISGIIVGFAGIAGLEGMSFGHLAVGNVTTAFPNYISPINGALGTQGFVGEPAALRSSRLADEGGLTLHVIGAEDLSVSMGVQQIKSFFELLRDNEAADLGILFEERNGNHFVYRTRTSLYNQAAVATLVYAHIMPGFQPTSDAKRVANDVTVSRSGGSTARYTIPDDDFLHYTTQDPPEGMRSRKASAQVEIESDDLLNEIAAWIAHIRSWREKRYSSVTIEISRDSVTADDETMILALDIGDVMELDTTGAPRWVPYSELRLMVQGYTEVLGEFLHTVTFNTSQADIYEAEVTDAGATSVLAAPIDDNDTTIRISPGSGPAWSESDEPYHIQVNGQPMTVTSISTAVPTFIATGTASHGSNASVVPALPAGITPDVGQLLLIWAAIRNSGTGTVNTPAGWRQIFAFGNTALLGRYYRTGDAAPTVTFTGGVANATTSAQMSAWDDLSYMLGSGPADRPAIAAQVNGSAANIAVPAMRRSRSGGARLYLGWKQDDWTSVTTTSTPGIDGEVGEPSSTTGDDQALYWSYDISTADSATAGGTATLVVTGGASAISRGVQLYLRPLQTATVTRGIAGVATSASVDDAIHAWRPGVNGL